MSENNGAGGKNRVDDHDGAEIAAKQTLWTRSFVIIWLVNFLNAVCFLLLMIVMSKVATDRFDASPALAGLSASIFVIGAFVLRPVLGKRIHHIGQTKVLYIGSFLSVAFTLAYFVVNSNGLLLLVRFLHGAAHGAAAMAVGTIIAGIVPRERYGEGLGYFTLGQTLSTAIGPFVGLLLLRHGSFDSIIITASAAAALALVLVPFLRVKDLELTAEQVAETKGFKLSNYIEPKAVPIGLALMLLFLCYSSVSSFLALYSEKIQLTTAAGVFFIVYAVVIFITRPAHRPAVRRQGRELGHVRRPSSYSRWAWSSSPWRTTGRCSWWRQPSWAWASEPYRPAAALSRPRSPPCTDGAGHLHLLHLRRHGVGSRSAVVRPSHPSDRLPGHVRGHGRRRGGVSGALPPAAWQACGPHGARLSNLERCWAKVQSARLALRPMTSSDSHEREEHDVYGLAHNEKTAEKGFTLIELLVVIVIIAILAAIAIPVFLVQRGKGQDAVAISLIRNAWSSSSLPSSMPGLRPPRGRHAPGRPARSRAFSQLRGARRRGHRPDRCGLHQHRQLHRHGIELSSGGGIGVG